MILNNKEFWSVFVQNEVFYTKLNYWGSLPFYLNAFLMSFLCFFPPKTLVNGTKKKREKEKIQDNKKSNLNQIVLWFVWKHS